MTCSGYDPGKEKMLVCWCFILCLKRKGQPLWPFGNYHGDLTGDALQKCGRGIQNIWRRGLGKLTLVSWLVNQLPGSLTLWSQVLHVNGQNRNWLPRVKVRGCEVPSAPWNRANLRAPQSSFLAAHEWRMIDRTDNWDCMGGIWSWGKPIE